MLDRDECVVPLRGGPFMQAGWQKMFYEHFIHFTPQKQAMSLVNGWQEGARMLKYHNGSWRQIIVNSGLLSAVFRGIAVIVNNGWNKLHMSLIIMAHSVCTIVVITN